MKRVVVGGAFDDLRSRQVRFLEQAACLGELHVLLWADAALLALQGRPPKFPQAERLYLLQSLRCVAEVSLVESAVDGPALLQKIGFRPHLWAVDEAADDLRLAEACRAQGVDYRCIPREQLQGFPAANPAPEARPARRKKVVVTGCFDWLHSGHVRFFEEASALGDLYVVVGSDANVRLLKGAGHPYFSQDERRYMVQSVRFVRQALISSGQGWMDAEPEIARIRPDIYVVNEDGDQPEKRHFCDENSLQYVVLRRAPRPGLPRRQSTDLRGF